MKSRHVLVVGADRDRLDRITPLLSGAGFEVHSVGDNELVLDLIQSMSFELLLVAYPTAQVPLETLLEAVRSRGGPCQSAGVLLMADTEDLEAAQGFVDRGANRAVGSDWPIARVWQAMEDLGTVQPRVFLQALVDTVDDDDQRTMPLLAENLSTTGMLLHGGRSWSPGTRIRFSFALPGHASPIAGTATIVRATDPEREGVSGCGARFESFTGDGQRRLTAFVKGQLKR